MLYQGVNPPRKPIRNHLPMWSPARIQMSNMLRIQKVSHFHHKTPVNHIEVDKSKNSGIHLTPIPTLTILKGYFNHLNQQADSIRETILIIPAVEAADGIIPGPHLKVITSIVLEPRGQMEILRKKCGRKRASFEIVMKLWQTQKIKSKL